jgi:hypothetical protein
VFKAGEIEIYSKFLPLERDCVCLNRIGIHKSVLI